MGNGDREQGKGMGTGNGEWGYGIVICNREWGREWRMGIGSGEGNGNREWGTWNRESGMGNGDRECLGYECYSNTSTPSAPTMV